MAEKKIVEKKKSSSPHEKSLCASCKKRILTLPFQCKFCGLEFCDVHRLPEDHSCLGLAARKEQLRSRLQRGERITYEPRMRKEIKVVTSGADAGHGFLMHEGEAGDERYSIDRKAMTDPLVKSPLAIIGMIVAAVAIAAILFLIFR